MQELYRAVAANFVHRVNNIWESEESLKAEFEKCFPKLTFTRTDYWNVIVHKIFRDAWLEAGPAVKSEPTGYDKMAAMRIAVNMLDYNIFSQVLLNMQNYLGIGYDLTAVKNDLLEVEKEWPKESTLKPFQAGATMVKKASTQEEIAYNTVLSMQRAAKIVAAFEGGTSFRVSPKGSTPAFADSKNISMIGAGGDKYLRHLPSLFPYYFMWAAAPTMANLTLGIGNDEKFFSAQPDISYFFYSKSGGEILQEALFARKLMSEVFKTVDITQKQCIQIPRMNSLMIVTQKYCKELTDLAKRLQAQYPGLEFSEGVRYATGIGAPAQAGGGDKGAS